MNNIQKIFLFFAIIFTFVIRLVVLDKVPCHLSNDEISIAYDAYSILQTGRDEHNNLFPLSFKSHETYKAPLYIYIASISNYFFGNSEYSVRLPSALFGSLTVFVFGYLIFILSKNINLSLISTFILSLTPWHIYTSRMALESNMALFFLTCGVFFFFISIIKKNNFYLFFSMLCFALSIWGYHTEWLLTPIIILFLFIVYRKKIKYNIFWGLSILVFFGLVFPIANNAWSNRNTNARANTEIIIKDPGIAESINNPNLSSIKKIEIIYKAIFLNYSGYTKLGHLFFDGLPLLNKEDPYSVGLFLLPLIPFFILGLFKIKLYFPNDYLFIYFWIIVSPLVPSLTIGGTNMVRNLTTILPYSLVMGVGLYNSKKYFKGYKLIFGILLLLISFFYFLIIYFYHFPFQMGENFQYGYKQAAEYIRVNYHKYDQIIIDPRFGDVNIYIGVPHLYLSYFTDLDPNYLLKRKDTPDGLIFDKYIIKSINWNSEIIDKKTLYLVPFDNQPRNRVNELKTVKQIYLPNNKLEFVLLEGIN